MVSLRPKVARSKTSITTGSAPAVEAMSSSWRSSFTVTVDHGAEYLRRELHASSSGNEKLWMKDVPAATSSPGGVPVGGLPLGGGPPSALGVEQATSSSATNVESSVRIVRGAVREIVSEIVPSPRRSAGAAAVGKANPATA